MSSLKRDNLIPKINQLPFLKPKKHYKIEEEYRDMILSERLNIVRS